MADFSVCNAYAQPWLQRLQQDRAIAVLRVSEVSLGQKLAECVIAGGLSIIEITWNSEQPTRLIAWLRERFPQCWIGTGTLLTAQDLQEAIACGCQFGFTPHLERSMVGRAVAAEFPLIPGALTPTEIVTSWQLGASSVKVFPVQAVGGQDYIQALQGPLGQIPLIPTGGVTLENAAQFLQAGAIAVGLSGQLFPKTFIQQQNWSAIQAQAQQLKQRIQPFCHHRGESQGELQTFSDLKN